MGVAFHLGPLLARTFFVPHPDFNYLNKLRSVPGEALFYWHHTVALLEAHGHLAWLVA